MSWTTRFIIEILLTSVTGTILFAVWYGIGQILEKMGYINILYRLLRLLLIFWFIPLAYITIVIDIDFGKDGENFLFFNTKTIEYTSKIIVMLWGFVVLYNCAKYIRNIYVTYLQCRENFECDVEMRDFFEDVCRQFSIKKGRVRVRQSLNTPVPLCVGTFRPMVILPSGKYTKEQMKVIFVHELIHYKHKDQWIKHLTFIAGCVHCFNPVVNILKKKVQIWAEYACDDAAVCLIESQKAYFQVILDLAETSAKLAGVYSSLVDDISEIENRMKHMQRSKNMIIKNRRNALTCVAMMFMVSVGFVYVVTCLAEKAYLRAYDATVEEIKEISKAVTEDGYVEYEVTGIGVGEIEDEGIVTVNDRSGVSYIISWNVPKEHSICSTELIVDSKKELTVTTIATPSDVEYRIGIVQPNGVRRYVSGTDVLTHTFSLEQMGTHYVYVQNMSTQLGCEISGVYRVQ